MARMMEKIKKYADKNGGIIDNVGALEAGISRSILSKFEKEKKIVRLERGQYVLSENTPIDEMLLLQLKCRHLIFSHETAFYLNGIIDRPPEGWKMTAPIHQGLPKSIAENYDVFFIDPKLHEVGLMTTVSPDGNTIKTYDVDRAMCDIIRARKHYTRERLTELMKIYMASPKSNPKKLEEMAEMMRVTKTIRRYHRIFGLNPKKVVLGKNKKVDDEE